MKLIDLSMTIQTHWRWPVKLEFLQSHEKGTGFQVCSLNLSMHTFTHIDTPLHVMPNQITIDQVSLDHLAGPAAILNLKVGPNQAITEEAVRKAGAHLKPGDIVLLKTGWDLQRDWKTREFWTEAPFVDEKAATWLVGQKIKAVGFDFPQDYHIRDIPARHPRVEELTTHSIILCRGIYLIEYLCNLHQIKVDRAEIFALPLKIAGAEGAPARVIAVVP
ncbi:MAG: cyclase family protein [Thermodesulfobacteriota bacterium]|jgi:kynurenine formamidase